MDKSYNPYSQMCEAAASFMHTSLRAFPKMTEAAIVQSKNIQKYWMGAFRYASAFMAPSYSALNAFISTESCKLVQNPPAVNMKDYGDLCDFNVRLANTCLSNTFSSMSMFYTRQMSEGFSALINTLSGNGGEGIIEFSDRQEQLLKVAIEEYPKAIRDIKSEFGFHFDRNLYVKAAETERFDLYQVLPSGDRPMPESNAKPILIIPPYVLGANILAFLPGEDRSYVHCFANQGIPTYIRIVKDIDTEPAVQLMTGEDDATDIAYFCKEIMARHEGRKVTLNGFCQGGYHSLAAILSGVVDGMVDALITCATPVDGSRSKSLKEYMMSLPPRFRDISFSMKTLPNGNKVVDGKILAWVYKLRKIASESPIPTFHRDLEMFEGQRGVLRINKTAAAINHWINFDQTNLPVGITRMSFESYIKPIDSEGNLPVTLFGKKLNLKYLEKKGIPWQICIADSDDLVDKEASCVALNYIDAEVCVFPKGHASLATSWSVPTSQCALHLRFCTPGKTPSAGEKIYRGPVCFQLDLQAKGDEMEKVPEIMVQIVPAAAASEHDEKAIGAEPGKRRRKISPAGKPH